MNNFKRSCPYLYRECDRPAAAACEVKKLVPECNNIAGWNKAVGNAFGCRFLGQHIAYDEYISRQEGNGER